MTKFLSILFNLVYAVMFGLLASSLYINMMNDGGYKLLPCLLICFAGYLAIHSLNTIFKKLSAFAKGSVVKGAVAIKRDLPLLAINIGIAANGITDIPWSAETTIYVIMSVFGIIGIICTASVARKYFE